MTPTHLVPGDELADRLRNAGVDGPVLVWGDVLNEGPVPAGLDPGALNDRRAEYLASQGWGSSQEIASHLRLRDNRLHQIGVNDTVVLWMASDLVDQLQRLQVLDRLATRDVAPQLRSVESRRSLDELDAAALMARFEESRPVNPALCQLARRVWESFRSGDPMPLMSALDGESLLGQPELRHALLRLIEEYPSVDNGLGRTDRQILESVAAAAQPLGDTWHQAHHEREEHVFLSDRGFLGHVRRMMGGPRPLLAVEGWVTGGDAEAMTRHNLRQTARLTTWGEAVLQGREDHVRLNGIDRWIGGVHLQGHRVRWRWDRSGRRLVDLARAVERMSS